ncbi:unnamed protein product [Cuscuta epithymum]|uniref:pantothenate kinase n=2 Tax=Cuscuta epithymum TaxID=186058 RepID=A0AAV0D1V1_9ASTE|nr:unnamed protein product [Cuscuta epithymum]
MERNSVDSNSDLILHVAIDIGGSLIKLVYFSNHSTCTFDTDGVGSTKEMQISNGDVNCHFLHGSLQFVKFETVKIDDCIKFLSSKQINFNGGKCQEAHDRNKNVIIKATGGGAFKFANLFKEKLGITLDKVDEMDCLVAGANFLLKAVQHEAFTHMSSKKEYVQIDQNDLYPYLLVNIGSGVSMIKVDRDHKFERVSGTSVGGGTFWGLGKLLTQCKSFDELLELSHEGNNRVVDMLVGDIYGTDYSRIGLASTAIASSFGKAISENKELNDYRPEDISRSLLRMISNNVAQIAYLNALRFGLKRIFFGGFFIRGHAYTMDTISEGVHFWSKGEAKALFFRHEGFLGALGALMNHGSKDIADLLSLRFTQELPTSVGGTEDSLHSSTLFSVNEN